MKKTYLLPLAAMLLLLTGCNRVHVLDLGPAPVSVHVNGFTITQEGLPQTKGTAVNEYSGVTAIVLAFYNSAGTEVFKSTQIKSDPSTFTTYGEFSCLLPYDDYTMVAIGYGYLPDNQLTLTSPTEASYTGAVARETFTATQSVSVRSSSPLDLTATLNRINAKLFLVSTDNRPANVTNIRMIFSAGSKSFNPTTGLAISNTGSTNTVGISTEVGKRTGSISYIFLTSDEQEMDVTIQTLDAQGNILFDETVEDVPFQRNTQTKMTGSLYETTASAGSFQLNTDWLTGNDISF